MKLLPLLFTCCLLVPTPAFADLEYAFTYLEASASLRGEPHNSIDFAFPSPGTSGSLFAGDLNGSYSSVNFALSNSGIEWTVLEHQDGGANGGNETYASNAMEIDFHVSRPVFYSLVYDWNGLGQPAYPFLDVELFDSNTSDLYSIDLGNQPSGGTGLLPVGDYTLFVFDYVSTHAFRQPDIDLPADAIGFFSFQTTPVPEPTSLALVGMGAVGLALHAGRWRASSSADGDSRKS